MKLIQLVENQHINPFAQMHEDGFDTHIEKYQYLDKLLVQRFRLLTSIQRKAQKVYSNAVDKGGVVFTREPGSAFTLHSRTSEPMFSDQSVFSEKQKRKAYNSRSNRHIFQFVSVSAPANKELINELFRLNNRFDHLMERYKLLEKIKNRTENELAKEWLAKYGHTTKDQPEFVRNHLARERRKSML